MEVRRQQAIIGETAFLPEVLAVNEVPSVSIQWVKDTTSVESDLQIDIRTQTEYKDGDSLELAFDHDTVTPLIVKDPSKISCLPFSCTFIQKSAGTDIISI